MYISKINSAPAFRGTLIVPNEIFGNWTFDGHTTVSTDEIEKIQKYKNGTRLMWPECNCFVSSKKVSFQDLAAAYNIAKKENITVDLTKSSTYFGKY